MTFILYKQYLIELLIVTLYIVDTTISTIYLLFYILNLLIKNNQITNFLNISNKLKNSFRSIRTKHLLGIQLQKFLGSLNPSLLYYINLLQYQLTLLSSIHSFRTKVLEIVPLRSNYKGVLLYLFFIRKVVMQLYYLQTMFKFLELILVTTILTTILTTIQLIAQKFRVAKFNQLLFLGSFIISLTIACF